MLYIVFGFLSRIVLDYRLYIQITFNWRGEKQPRWQGSLCSGAMVAILSALLCRWYDKSGPLKPILTGLVFAVGGGIH